MSDTLQWVEQIRSDLRPLEDKILGHSYLRALDEGCLPNNFHHQRREVNNVCLLPSPTARL